MRKLIATIALASAASVAQANCIGSDSLKTCYDSESGNSYTISSFGNTTIVNGSNASTGSTWSSTSNTFGNTTFQTGQDKHGRSWNQTIQRMGDSTFHSGQDSDGNSFSKLCTSAGCF